MALIVISSLMTKKSVSLNLIIKLSTFLLTFVQVAYPESLTVLNLEKYEIKVFSVDYSAIDKFDMLNTHKYLMIKGNIKNAVIYKAGYVYCVIEFQLIFSNRMCR